MTMDSMSISLDEFVRYLLKKWIIISICMILGVVSSVAGAKICGNEIVIPPSEDYEELKTQETYFENYIAHAILMEMNPLNIYERTIYINEFSDRNELKDFVESELFWKEYGSDISTAYLADLITWQEWETSDCIEVDVWHSEEDGCEELAKYVAKQIQLYDKKAEVLIGQQNVVVDEMVSDQQIWSKQRLQDIKGQLEYTAAGCTIEISSETAIVFGTLCGGFIGLVICFAGFILKKDS